MSICITTEQHFEAAHRLPQVPADHKCARLHGHSYRVEVTCTGPIDPQMGWVMDFGDIDAVLTPLVASLDHRLLNDLPGLANPTCEVLVVWLWQRLAPQLPALASITVHETARHRATYHGP